jgi:DNA repair photolyase
MPAERLFELARRTFDTPAFRGIECIEVEAKSVINHVPGGSLPFDWTINPYRGCTHACVYCMAGETEILMADGRTKPLADVQVGDHVYGTQRDGRYRRYTTTDVLAHWSTQKPAYRVTLGDGTTLVTSADHRFLTRRGWKHVTGSQQGADRRSHLTRNDRLLGPGRFPIEGRALKNSPGPKVATVEPLGVSFPMFDVTTGTGDFIANGVVSHNCFARPTHAFLDMSAGRDFETKIVVKVNAPEVLRRELAAKRWKGEHIAMGTNTDPYQRVEGRYRLMRGILEALIDHRNPFSVLTKGTLILRDLDLFLRAAEVAPVSAAFSIGTLDERVRRETEPGTPSPRTRIEAVRTLNEAGIPTGVLIAPVLPGISDAPEQLRAVVEAALDAGATTVSLILLHLRPGVREEFMPWLEEHHPDLVPRYRSMYRRPYGPKEERSRLAATVGHVVRERGGPVPRSGSERFRQRPDARARPEASQLPLW